jgi:hypothetical protein
MSLITIIDTIIWSEVKEIAEMVLVNPLIPQSWGTFEAGGAPPAPRQEVPCASFSAVSKGK